MGTNLDTGWVQRTTGHKGDSLSALAALRPPNTLIAPLEPLMADASIILLNVEGAIGDGPAPDAKCVPPHRYCFPLRSPSTAARAIRTVGDSAQVVVGSLANNHAYDAGDDGFRLTAALLDSAGVLVTGVDSEPTIAVTSGGDTVAFLGFSAWTEPGVIDLVQVRRLIARAAARYRRLIVTAHLGAEGRGAQRTGDSLEHFAGEVRGNSIAFAHAAAEAGAGLVIGTGPHVLRGAEWWHGTLIFYSLGNLINYGPFRLSAPLDRGAILCATLDSVGSPSHVVLRATRQPEPGTVRPDASRRALVLVDSLSRLDFSATGASVNRVSGAVGRRIPTAASHQQPPTSPASTPARPPD